MFVALVERLFHSLILQLTEHSLSLDVFFWCPPQVTQEAQLTAQGDAVFVVCKTWKT